MNKDVFEDLVEECRCSLGLQYSPGLELGTTAVFSGMLPFLRPDLAGRLRGALVGSHEDFSIPSVQVDPLGFALAARSFCRPLDAEIMTMVRSKLLDYPEWFASLPWNHYHVALGAASLRLLSATCLQNGIKGRTRIVRDVALVHRLRQQSFHVLIEPRPLTLPLRSVEEVQRTALGLVKSVRPKLIIYSNWQKPHISRRSSAARVQDDATKGPAISIRLFIPKVIRARLIRDTEEEEKRDLALVDEANRRHAMRDSSLGARTKRSTASDETFSAFPPRRGVTESLLERIRTYARSKFESDPAALAIALLDACAVGDSDLANMRLFRNGDGYMLSTPCPLLTRRDPQSAHLHVPVTDEFIRPIPTLLARCVQKAMDSDCTSKLLESRNRCFAESFSTTSAKVRHAMRFQVPVWNEMPWTFYDMGLVPVRFDERGHARMPGYRHYLTWNPSEREACLAGALDRLGWKIQSASTDSEVLACGSANTPSIQVVRDMARCLKSLVLLVEDKPRMNCLQSVALINAISALSRLFLCLFTFTRNYPCTPPGVIINCGRPSMIDTINFRQEKIRLRPVVYTSCLVSMLEDVSVAFHFLCHCLEAQGHRFVCTKEAPEWSSSAFGFVECAHDGRSLRLMNPRKALIRSGLLHHPATESFGAVDQNCMRNLAYYLLANDQKHQFSVMTFCDHYPSGSGGALIRSSGAPIVHRQELESACNEIAAACFWPWLR